jgi:P pilus assembly chaperone PapD
MVKKVLVSLALAGSLAAGCAGGAEAASVSNCTNAPATISHLQAEETQVAAMLVSLQKMVAPGKREAWWLQQSIAFLTRAEARLTARIDTLQGQCTTTASYGSNNLVG